MSGKCQTVFTLSEAEDLLRWRWKPLRKGREWYLCKYARRRKVHTSVVLTLQWDIGTYGAAAAGVLADRDSIAQRLADSWRPLREGTQCYLVRGNQRLPLHPDLYGVTEMLLHGEHSLHAQKVEAKKFSSAGARAPKVYSLTQNPGQSRKRNRGQYNPASKPKVKTPLKLPPVYTGRRNANRKPVGYDPLGE